MYAYSISIAKFCDLITEAKAVIEKIDNPDKTKPCLRNIHDFTNEVGRVACFCDKAHCQFYFGENHEMKLRRYTEKEKP